jgi:hypothetical protein
MRAQPLTKRATTYGYWCRVVVCLPSATGAVSRRSCADRLACRGSGRNCPPEW